MPSRTSVSRRRDSITLWFCLVVGVGHASGCGEAAPPKPEVILAGFDASDTPAPFDAKKPTGTSRGSQAASPPPAGLANALPAPLPPGLPAGSVLLGDARHRLERLESGPVTVAFSNAFAAVESLDAPARLVRLTDGVEWDLPASGHRGGDVRRLIASGDVLHDPASADPTRPLMPPGAASAEFTVRSGPRFVLLLGADAKLLDLTTGALGPTDPSMFALRHRVQGDAGPRLALRDVDSGEVHVVEAQTGQLVASGVLSPAPDWAEEVILSSDGTTLMWLARVVEPSEHIVHVLTLPAVGVGAPPIDLARAASRRVPVGVIVDSGGLVLSDDGRRFAVAHKDRVVFRDTLTGAIVATRPRPAGDKRNFGSFSGRMTDADTLWYAGDALSRLSVTDSQVGPDHGDLRGQVIDHVFTTEGVTAIDAHNVLAAWSREGRLLRRITIGAQHHWNFHLSDDGLRVTRVTWTEAPPLTTQVELLDATTGGLLASVELPGRVSVSYVAAGDGPVVIHAGPDSDTIWLWHKGVLSPPRQAVGFSRYHGLLASQDSNTWIRQVDQRVSHLNASLNPVRRLSLCGKNPKMDTPVALSPSGRLVAAICTDGSLVIATVEADRRGAPVSEHRSPPLVAPEVPMAYRVAEDSGIMALAFCGEASVLVQVPGTLWRIGVEGTVLSEQRLITPSARLRAPLRCDPTGRTALTTWRDGRSVIVPVAAAGGAAP